MASQRHKVVVIFHEPVLGGATLSVLRTIPLLERKGWEFAFWVDKPSPLFDELTARGYEVAGAPRLIAWSLPVLRLPPGPLRRLSATPGYLRQMLAFVRAQRPALVHANSMIALPEAIAAKRSGAPVLFHVHEMSRRSVRGRIARRLAWRADELIAVSRASAQALSTGGRVPRVVYEAAVVPEEPLPVRERPEPFVLGCLGVISTRKGSDLFVDAAIQAMAAKPGIEFRLVGGLTDVLDVDWGREVIRRADAAGIVYKERVDTMEELRSWDGFVLPSRNDPFPIAMLEAMAAGLPVIGTAVDGIAEQVTPDCGRLVPSGDIDGLAEAMLWLAALDAEGRKALGGAGRRRVSESFTVERQADELHDAYVTLVGASAGGASTSTDPTADRDRSGGREN